MKTKSRISHGELGIAAVDRVTGETCAVAKILPVRTTIDTFAIGPAEPGNAHPIAHFKLRIFATTDFFDGADNLVSGNQWQFRIRQFAIDHVEIGPADGTSIHADEQFACLGLRLWHVAQLQRLPGPIEHHRAHARKINDE